MLYYKSCIGNKKNTYLMVVFFIITIILFQGRLVAQPCTMYMVSTLNSPPSPTLPGFSGSIPTLIPTPVLRSTETQTPIFNEYNDINEALLKSTSGEVICFRDGVYSPIRIENIQGGIDNITLKAETADQVKITHNNYSGTGVYIKNSKNIIISGFSLSGGLYGIYATGSSDLTLVDNTIYNIGQEGIIVKSGIATQPLTNFFIANNVISDTGNRVAQYGEGIYIGDGNDNYNEIITDIIIQNNNISHTMNEAIDIKINTKNVVINSNTIINTNLKFNGVITVATTDRYAEDSNITISHNNIIGVVNRSGYRAIGIAVGQGNASINNNLIVEQGKHFAGICLFSTFVNTEANTVTLDSNKVLTAGRDFIANCGHGGTGANALANVNEVNF